MGIGELTVSQSKVAPAVTFPGGENREKMKMVIFGKELSLSSSAFPKFPLGCPQTQLDDGDTGNQGDMARVRC